MNNDKKCLLHVPGHYKEECKVLKEYSEKYTAQRPHKEACSGGNKNRGKSVESDGKTQEVNSMVCHTEPIPRKKKEKNQKDIIFNKPVQTHQKIDVLMSLAT